MNSRKLNLLAVIFGVCIAATIYGVVVYGGKTKQEPQKPQITTLPKIKSCVPELIVQSSFLRKRDPNSDSMQLVLQLMNNSDTPMVAVSIEWKSKEEHTEDSLVINSFGADEPKILAAPHSLYEVAIPLGNIPPDASVQVGSIVFADGREEGCTNSLKELRELKSRYEKASKNSKEREG